MNSRKNSLKHGLTGKGVVLPAEEEAEVEARRAAWVEAFRPEDEQDRERIDRTVLAGVRMERAQKMEAARRVEAASRALSCWDEDRRLAAEELATRLAKKPALVARQLRRTLQGCELLIDRWRGLLRVAEAGNAWDEPQRSRALDLLGVPVEDRAHHPRIHDKATAEDLATVAREEVEHLEGRRDGYLADHDESERLLAETGLAFDDSPTGRRLWGYERSNARLYFRGLDELNRRRRARGDVPAVPRPSAPKAVAGAPRVPTPVPLEPEPTAVAPPAPRADVPRVATPAPAATVPLTIARPTPFAPAPDVGNRRDRRARKALARRRA